MLRPLAVTIALFCSSCATALTAAPVTDLRAATARAPKAAVKVQSLLEMLMGEPEKPAVCPANGLISIIDEITSESAHDFVRTLEACKGRRVAVEINSPGGSLFAALDMQKAIERHDKAVLCVVDGMAASAAFITLQSCTTRYMTDRSVLMAHTAAVGVQGHEQALRNGAEALKAIDQAQALHCAKRMGMAPEDYAAKIADGREWWLSETDALDAHAVDGDAESVAEIVGMVN